MQSSSTSDTTTPTLSYDEAIRILKVIAAYNSQSQPLEFNQAFLSYADHIQIQVDRPDPNTIRITYKGVR